MQTHCLFEAVEVILTKYFAQIISAGRSGKQTGQLTNYYGYIADGMIPEAYKSI